MDQCLPFTKAYFHWEATKCGLGQKHHQHQSPSLISTSPEMEVLSHLCMCIKTEPQGSSLSFLRCPGNEISTPGLDHLTSLLPWWNSPRPIELGLVHGCIHLFTGLKLLTECLLCSGHALCWPHQEHFPGKTHRHRGSSALTFSFFQRVTTQYLAHERICQRKTLLMLGRISHFYASMGGTIP